MKLPLVVLSVTAIAAGLTGCTNLKPLQAKVDDLTSQVARLTSDLASARQESSSAAQAATQTANSAQTTANQALAAAQGAQGCCDATNEKLDRMFRKNLEK
jgi:outer membrane murein-binding lipoprotein Lpp